MMAQIIDSFKKFGRALRRDHLPLVPRVPLIAGGTSSAASAIMRGSISAASAAATVLTLAIIAGVSWGFKYNKLRKKTHERMDVREINNMVYTLDLQGPGGKMHTIVSTQNLINSLTKKFRTAAQLPPKLQKRIDAHIADAAEAAKDVRATLGGEEVREIEFLRTVVKPLGQLAEEPVGKIAVLHTPTPDEIDAKAKAEAAAKIAEGAQAASAIHAGSATALTVKTIKLKKQKTRKSF
ncbi:MAG: hypothetical protein ACAH80_11535 [Alphaproteobacteria bacterium]